ncbi:EsaB/YukD family protein [Microbacterium sp. 179-I 3D4 NHS]|uniref:EsaB/YukD family protein n=1 Tax=Microbacterium sp. 179-I 3D4 NHS TaxID=3142381 RepID=UPI0039A3BCCB
MSGYTRITVSGSARRTEVALASAEPLGAVLPQLIDLLSEPTGTGGRPLVLVDALGRPLDPDRSPRDQELRDGTLLQLLPFDAAPPPPLVIDVVDVVAEELAERRDRWDDRARRAVGAVLVAMSTAVAASALPSPPPLDVPVTLALLALLVAGALGCGLAGARGLATLLCAGALGTVPALALHLAEISLEPTRGAVPVTGAALAASVVLLVGRGLGSRCRGAVLGGAVGVVLFGALLLGLLAGAPAGQAAAVVGVLAAAFAGAVPWAALSVSGLTDLDHRAAEGAEVGRLETVTSIGHAYSALTWTVAALAVALAVCGGMLWGTGETWSRLLAVALAGAAVMRSRAFPVRSQGLLLWAAGLSVAGIAAASALGTVPSGALVLGCLVLAASASVGALVRPRPHRRARLRAVGDAVETAVVVSLLPLAVGVFGVYPDLLGMFGAGA